MKNWRYNLDSTLDLKFKKKVLGFCAHGGSTSFFAPDEESSKHVVCFTYMVCEEVFKVFLNS